MSEAARDDPALPPRPAIPAVVPALVACVVIQAWTLAADPGPGPRAALAATALGILALALWRRCPLPAMPAAPVAAASLAALVSASCLGVACDRIGDSLATTSASSLEFEVVADPSRFGERWRARARARSDEGVVGDVWLVTDEEPGLGERIRCVGSVERAGDDEWGRRDRARGVCATVIVRRVLSVDSPAGPLGPVRALRARVLGVIDPGRDPGRALLAGCVCGYRVDLVDLGLEDALSNCGLVHLVAVSGSHLTTVAAALSALLGAARIRPGARAATLLASTGLFVAFCGAPTSAVRAWAMSASAYAAPLAGRRAHALSGVGTTGLAMCLLDPATASDMGFQLSALSVGGLCVLSPHAEYALAALLPRLGFARRPPAPVARLLGRATRALGSQVCSSVVAQLVTMPVTVAAFGTVPLVGPLANALVGPAFSWLVTLGCAAAALSWVPALGPVALGACDALASGVLGASLAVAGVPGGCVACGDASGAVAAASAVASLALLALWPRVSRRRVGLASLAVAALALVLALRWGPFAGPRVIVLDVGQGDAILVQDGSHAVLVDTGPDDAVVGALARNHVRRLDAVVITHLHDDHYGGLPELAGLVRVGAVYVGEGVSDNLPGEVRDALRVTGVGRARELGDGDVIALGGFELEVLWPPGPTEGDDNADSLVLLVTYEGPAGTLSALLCGDAESDVVGPLAEGVGRVDVLKLGHHGSEASVDEGMLSSLDPALAVASAGEDNPYGHPDEACVAALRARGIPLACTMGVGDVCVEPGEDGVRARCSLPYDWAT